MGTPWKQQIWNPDVRGYKNTKKLFEETLDGNEHNLWKTDRIIDQLICSWREFPAVGLSIADGQK